jgi:hypothetical protein
MSRPAPQPARHWRTRLRRGMIGSKGMATTLPAFRGQHASRDMDAPPALLTSALESGERLTWWDRPQRGIVFRGSDGFLIPFSIVWASGASYGAVAMLNKATFSPPEVLMSLLFLALAIYIVIGRFLHDVWRRGRIVYGLTDRRVLIVRPSKLVSLSLEGITELNLEERGSGRGSIGFGPGSEKFGWNRQSPWSGEPAVPTFELIAEARKVHTAIRDAQKKAQLASAAKRERS